MNLIIVSIFLKKISSIILLGIRYGELFCYCSMDSDHLYDDTDNAGPSAMILVKFYRLLQTIINISLSFIFNNVNLHLFICLFICNRDILL